MGVIFSRYLDENSSEGAILRFALDSLNLVHTMCTTDSNYTEITPWNVIDFNTNEITGYSEHWQQNETEEGGIE